MFLCRESEGIMFSLVSTNKTPIMGVHWDADRWMHWVGKCYIYLGFLKTGLAKKSTPSTTCKFKTIKN